MSPKEYAQSISDVASAQHARQISLALDAGNGAGKQVGAGFDQLKQDQALLQAIKRQPLAASFVRGDRRFGWVLGPKYDIQNGKPGFVHTTARYTFTASVAVPGWMSRITLTGCGHWIDANGHRTASFPLFDDPGAGGAPTPGDARNAGCGSTPVTINLPNRHRALVRALVDSRFDLMDEPEIYRLIDGKNGNALETTRLQATDDTCSMLTAPAQRLCEQTLVIEGRDLWRNPTVFIGEQRADRVDVLPSMRGVVATWKHLKLPPGGTRQLQDLFVSTSTGEDRLQRAVQIERPPGRVGQPFARLAGSVLVPETAAGSARLRIGFQFAPSAFPRGYAAVGLQLRPAGVISQAKTLEEGFERSVGSLTWTVTDLAAAGLKSSGDVDVDLVFKLAPHDDWQSLSDPSARRATFFANPAERELSYIGGGKADFSAGRSFATAELARLQTALQFRLPADRALFLKGWPGLGQALAGQAGDVRISMRFDEATEPVSLLAERAVVDGKTVIRPRIDALAAQRSEILPEDEREIAYRLAVCYRQAGTECTEIQLDNSGAQLSVKGLKKPAPKPAAPKTAKGSEAGSGS